MLNMQVEDEMDKTIEFAKKVYGANTEWSGAPLDRLEQLVALVRADEREETNRRANASWTLMCEKMVAAERDACAKVCETHAPTTTPTWVSYAAAIRARK
jgi:hypothetical protein